MQDEREVPPRGFGWMKLLIFVIMVVIIVGVALYSFFHINPMELIKSGFDGIYQRMLQTVGESRQKIQDVLVTDPSQVMSYDVQGTFLVAASISDVKLIGQDGGEQWYVPVSLKKPYVQSDQGDILVADLAGRYFALVRDGKLLWEKSLDEDIVNASLSENFILLVTKSLETGYKRTIHAFSREGVEISFRSVADYYPFAAYYFPHFDKARIIAAGIGTQGLETASLFEFLDLSMNQKGSLKGEKEIYTGALSPAPEQLLLYGEKSLTVMDRSLATLWRTDLAGDFLTAICSVNNQWIVTAVLDGELLNREKHHLTKVRILDTGGRLKSQVEVDSTVTDIDAAGRTIAFVAGHEVYFINDRGEVMDLYTARIPVRRVLLANEGLAYVITDDGAVSIRVEVKNKFLGIF